MGSSYSVVLPKDLIVKILLLNDPEDIFGVCYDHRLRMIPFFWNYKAVIQEQLKPEYWKHALRYLKEHCNGTLNQYHFCRYKNQFACPITISIDGKKYCCEPDLIGDPRGLSHKLSDYDKIFLEKTVMLMTISYEYPQTLMFEISRFYIRENGFMVLTGIKV